MKVAVLAGGRSSEHEVSLASGAAVRGGLARAGHEPLAVEVSAEGRWTCAGSAVAVEPGGGLLGADAVFPVLHGPFGEDGTVQGLLEVAGVPYVGAGVLASALCMNKVAFKRVLAQAGLPQVEHEAVRARGDRSHLERLGLPAFVKPARLGSSVGISKVESPAQLGPALDAAFAHDPLAVVERMARGREVECSVIGNREPLASEPGEVTVPSGWYDYDSKYRPGGMDLTVPADVGAGVREEVRRLALEVYRLVDCAGMARIDFFVEEGGAVLVNELNTIPGFTQTSVFARLFEASGIGYEELLDRLLAFALERYEEGRRYRF